MHPGDSVFLKLFGNDVPAGDLPFVVLHVAGKFDDLHAILQGERYCVPDVGRCDEHDMRQIVVKVEIVVVERYVLLGVKHFEERRRRVAAKIHAHFVDLVEQHHGVDHSCPLHGLDDFPRHGADVRPTMAADLRLISHPAEGDAHQLPAERPGNRLRQRGLAYSRRADKTKDLPLHLAHKVEHRNVLQNSLLRLFQPEVVLIEDRLNVLHRKVVFRPRMPRHGNHPVQIAPDDGRLR